MDIMYPRKFWRDSSELSEEVHRLPFCFISIFLGMEIPRVYSETRRGLLMKKVFLMINFHVANKMMKRNGALIKVVFSLYPSKSEVLILNWAKFWRIPYDLNGRIPTGTFYTIYS